MYKLFMLNQIQKIIKFLQISLLVITANHSMAGNNSLEITGDIVQIALPVSAGIYSLVKKDYTGMKELFFSGVATNVVVYGLKYTVNERRPNGGSHSFPSGHTAISFASSTYLWKRYGPGLGIPTTLLAGFVGYTRIEARKHFFHDVAAGAAIGALASYLITHKYQENIEISPEGVALKLSF